MKSPWMTIHPSHAHPSSLHPSSKQSPGYNLPHDRHGFATLTVIKATPLRQKLRMYHSFEAIHRCVQG